MVVETAGQPLDSNLFYITMPAADRLDQMKFYRERVLDMGSVRKLEFRVAVVSPFDLA